jgi:hypothetical protein
MSISEIKKHIEATVASLGEWERALLADPVNAPSEPIEPISEPILLPGFSAPDHMPGGGINVELRHEDPAKIADRIRRKLEDVGSYKPHLRSAAEYPIDEDAPSVYVAGPMRGKVDHNYPTFHAVTENLRRQGFIVKNPAENFDGDQSHELSEYMELDLQMVMDTEGIVLLPGWRDSELGRIEAAMAKALEHKFYEATLVDETDASYGVDPFSPDSWIITPIPTPTSTDNRGIDGEARSLVFGARNATYGSPALDFTVIGRIWAAILSAHLQEHIEDIPPDVVAVLLTGLKLGRQGRTPGHHDSRVDVIGYQLCLDRIVTNDGETPDG